MVGNLADWVLRQVQAGCSRQPTGDQSLQTPSNKGPTIYPLGAHVGQAKFSDACGGIFRKVVLLAILGLLYSQFQIEIGAFRREQVSRLGP